MVLYHIVKGMSNDVKPVGFVRIGKKYLELDTGKVYMWTGAGWNELIPGVFIEE